MDVSEVLKGGGATPQAECEGGVSIRNVQGFSLVCTKLKAFGL